MCFVWCGVVMCHMYSRVACLVSRVVCVCLCVCMLYLSLLAKSDESTDDVGANVYVGARV